MTDWNKLTMEQYIEHLEEKFKFDSSGTAKAVFELINAYKALTIPVVVVPKGTLFCENVIHHTCKHFDDIVGCDGCLVKDFEAK